MSFIRAEAAASLRKYRSFILAGLIGLAGVYILFTGHGTAYLAAVMFLLIAALAAHDGYKRLRFPAGTGGAGVVEVDERRISYLAAQGGKSMSLDDLSRVEIHRNSRGRITWVFYSPGEMFEVPGDAMGTDKLFDALVALPGVNYAQAEAASQGQGPDLFLIWQKDRTKLH